ncbi:TPA: hypothetical protein MCN62_004451 [Klebsiella pneumoniae]|uniref:hypothetical protein n=1 Tax=Klebsiella pneumoniae TaxID=573 RepID=UPI001E3E2DC4|nr:hypothetical protein [Klebsiella pneumoniae]HDK6392825.1 hypothetical protein [Klebsiella variicola]MCD5840710.1 hypothetical protein [Klebsiella pneumoniae]WLY17844.1 hypothetical protein RA188_05795 [Klebsiella pneumoniae]HBT9723776.1 hypothetical protein [Klebsiella pneumoniae]HBY7812831.1 hypothetical protein [Klebsiella pneumoniae]
MTGKISWTTTLPDGTISKFEAESAALNNTDMGNLKSFVESIPRATPSTSKKETALPKWVGAAFLIIFIIINISYIITPEEYIKAHNIMAVFVFIAIIIVAIYSICLHLIFSNNTISIGALLLSLVCIALTTKVTTINSVYSKAESTMIEKTKDSK